MEGARGRLLIFMSQATSSFSYESQGTTVYVSVGKLPPIRRLCQRCQKPLSGRGMWKFCRDHAQEAYIVDRRIRERRREDSIHVEFWTRVAAEDYVSVAVQRKHAVLPTLPEPKPKGRKCPRCDGRMKRAFDLWTCGSCGYEMA
jgi:ribosomal protein S27AE